MKLSKKMTILAVSFLTPLCLCAQQNPTVPQNTIETNVIVAPQGNTNNSVVPQSSGTSAAQVAPGNQIPADAYVIPYEGSFNNSYALQPSISVPQYDYEPSSGYTQSCCNSFCGDNRFKAEIDWLYWQVRGLNSIGSITNSYGSIDSQNGSHTDVKCVSPKSHFDSGVRLGLWYNDPCSCVNFGIIWTEIHNSWTRSYRGNSNSQFSIGSEIDGISLSNFRSSTQTKTYLDYLDFDFSYNYDLAYCFSLTPHVGIRALWFEGSIRNRTNGIYQQNSNETSSRWHQTHKDDAVGIEGGIWLAWQTRWCVKLFGHFAGSLLYYTNKYHEGSTVTTNELGPNSFGKRHCKTHTTSPMFNYALGLEYDKSICNRNVAFRASWEQVHIDYQYLQWQGLTLGVAVGF